jgi:putative acetyltransferase
VARKMKKIHIVIRNESENDAERISEITRAAFQGHPYSRQTEQYIVRALRESGALIISLVAEVEGKVIGHAAFSPVGISGSNADWYGLGPISVVPELQRQGIGKALLNRGIELLGQLNAGGCVLVGDPAYYGQFGFRNFPGLVHEGVPDEFVLALPIKGIAPTGTVTFHEAFRAER